MQLLHSYLFPCICYRDNRWYICTCLIRTWKRCHTKRDSRWVCQVKCVSFLIFFVVADKSTTIFMGFNQTEVLHLWILNQMFCEYIGQLNLPQKIYLCKKFIIYFIWCWFPFTHLKKGGGTTQYITNHADKNFFTNWNWWDDAYASTYASGAKRRNGIWCRDRGGSVTCVGH